MKFSSFLSFLLLLFFHQAIVFGQSDTLSKKEQRILKRQLKVEQGKLLVTPLGGPAYTPEMKLTLAGSIMFSYKTNPRDSLIQRSSSPVSFGISTTGAVFVSTIITSFWLKDKMRIYADIWYKNMPDHYWGVGFENAYYTPKSDSTTAYKRNWLWFNPRILWQFKPNYFIGLNIDYNYTMVSKPSTGVQLDAEYLAYGPDNFNSGFGIIALYDSRDIPVNAYKGLFVDMRATFYSKVFGGDNQYQVYLIDVRKYFTIYRKGSTLATQIKTRFGTGNIPYGELSQPGTPFDLRGYTWGQYRDKSMLFLLAEYRYMFKKKSGDLSRHGLVIWTGTGTIGADFSEFNAWLPNIGLGYRFEVQPRMNLRIDFGMGRKTSGFYLNFNEAF